jgi:hypothetical protein
MRPTRRSATPPRSRRNLTMPFAALFVAIALTAIVAASAGAAADPVLGSKAFTAPVGAGFGSAEPSEIFNGGDPSGSVTKIHWTGWGNPSAIGYGLNPIFKPGGGYYAKPARIELRATDLGHCGTSRAYTRLEARFPQAPRRQAGQVALVGRREDDLQAPLLRTRRNIPAAITRSAQRRARAGTKRPSKLRWPATQQ